MNKKAIKAELKKQKKGLSPGSDRSAKAAEKQVTLQTMRVVIALLMLVVAIATLVVTAKL